MAGTTGAPGNIPLFDDDSDFAPIQNPFNSISNALNNALAVFQAQTFLRYATKAAMDAVPGVAIGQHATVYADSTPANNGDYVWSGSEWVRSPRIAGVKFLAGTGQVLPTIAAAITGLSLTVTLPATPVLIRATLGLNNAGSNADRAVAARIYDGSTGIGTQRNFTIPFITSATSETTLVQASSHTPTAGSHTYTVQANASVASAITVSDCILEAIVL